MMDSQAGKAPWAVMTIDAPGEAEEDLVRLLCRRGALGVQTDMPLQGSLTPGRAVLRAWFDAGAPLPSAGEMERLCPAARGLKVLSTGAEPDGRWVERWIASLGPFDVGARFRIVPVADAEAGPPREAHGSDPMEGGGGRIPLRIVPGRAFGTGEHATTRLCLEALERIPETRIAGRSLLDAGTGSGILAMAGLALGFRRAVGLDVDPEAIRVARANAGLNPWARGLELKVGEPGGVTERFRTVVANLNRGILERCLPDLARAVEPGGDLILSGLLDSEAREMAARAAALGAARPAIEAREGWACVALEIPVA